MKQSKLLFTISLLFSVLISCSKDSAPNGSEKLAEQKPIIISAAIANNITDFSFDFFKTLQTDPAVNSDAFVSPLSLHMALGMLVNGATAETKAEIMKTLKSENLSQTELNETYKKLLKELPEVDPKVKMALANSIWYKNGYTVEPAFLTNMKDYFNAKVAGLAFAPSDTSYINGWVRDNTNGKINKVLSNFEDNLIMLLMNALYFKGDWTTQFDPNKTSDQPFTLENGTNKTVKMMNQQDSFEYASFIDYYVLRMPYGNGQFVATLILPKVSKTISGVFNEFDATKWNDVQNNLQKQTVIVGVPKFKLTQEFSLNNTLKKMGMQKAFSDGAEFGGILKNEPIKVSFIKQNTFVAVDEVGTEAAAVTTIGMVTTSLPSYPSFICNRPFGFIISEKTSNTILFMGRVMNPEAN